jgi:uracil-DNA glycosylase family 4
MRNTYVPPRGNPQAKIAIVGEQPGYTEIRWHPPTPFVGPAGEVLDSCLNLAGIARHDCWVTNVIKDLDKPLAHYINLDKVSTISADGWSYINQLKSELEQLRPNIVVACGNVPLLALCNRTGITKWRGSVIESTLVANLKVIPTFHPATCIPPKSVYTNKPMIVFDLKRAIIESEYPELRRETRNVKIQPSFDEAIANLQWLYKRGIQGNILDFDIEVINEELDCFSFAWSPYESISIPLRCAQGDYFTIDQEYEVLKWVALILESPRIAKRGANFIFDTQFMMNKYGIKPRGPLHCTQVAQKILTPDYPAGLDFVTSIHTDIPYYKQDGKKWMKMGVGSWETWWNYNGMDTIATAAAHPKQMEDLLQQGNMDTYERQRLVIPPLLYMAHRGIKVDVAGIITQRDKEILESEQLTEQFKSIAGYDLNPNSPAQLADYFYKKLNHPPYKKRTAKGWVVTTDIDALKRLARKGIEAAKILMKIRKVNKRVGTYLDIRKIDPDGRYRSSYKPVGTETGRLSSGETIFGTGGNQQNWPHDLLQYFKFDDGYIGYSFDLSQAENRIVAYVGGIVQMIEAFEKNIDVHRMTASLILGKGIDEISDEPGSSDLGDGEHSERDWGKRGNHSLNYDFGYKSFALKFEMPEAEAKWIVEQYHRAYPGVRQNYHSMVQNLLKSTRTITNCYGRKRLFMGAVNPNPPATPYIACHATYKEAYAQIPQSSVADKINEDGVEFIYYNPSPLFKPIEMLTQIHDSIVFQIPISVPWSQHAAILKMIKDSLERQMQWHDTPIPIPADLAIGFNMYKKQMIDVKAKNFPSSLDTLAQFLESTYEKLKAQSK